MKIRMATPKDAEHIYEVLRQVFSVYENENYPIEAVKTAVVPLSEVRKRIKRNVCLWLSKKA